MKFIESEFASFPQHAIDMDSSQAERTGEIILSKWAQEFFPRRHAGEFKPLTQFQQKMRRAHGCFSLPHIG